MAFKDGWLRRLGHSWLDWFKRESQEPQEFILKLTRFITSIFSTFALVSILVPQSQESNNRMSVVVLDTSTVDIFAGLYETVGNTLSSGDLNFGETLSTSQIIAITNVTTSMLLDTPDYVSSGIYSTCFHYTYRWKYDSSGTTDLADPPPNAEKLNPMDKDESTSTTTDIKCIDSSLYDYRKILKDKFEVLSNLVYFDGDTVPTMGQMDLDSQYQQWKEPRESILKTSTILLLVICISEFFLLIFTGVYYRMKQNHYSEQRMKVTSNVLAFISVSIFIISAYSTISMVLVLHDFKDKIHNELSNFKISLHLSTGFFFLLWTIFSSNSINMVCWVMPVWCQTAADIEESSTETYEIGAVETAHLVHRDTSDTFKDNNIQALVSRHTADTFENYNGATIARDTTYMRNQRSSTRINESNILIDVPFKD